MATSTNKNNPTILILGAGIFGTSTAYHLSLSYPSPCNVTIIDRNAFPPPPATSATKPPLGASYDINKIVRADYSAPFYMNLGHEAIDAWSQWPLLKPFYHPTGWIMLDEKGSDLAERIRKNFRECGRKDPTSDTSLIEVGKAWGGVLSDADLTNFEKAYWNPQAGWVEADKAIDAMLKEAVKKGVRCLQGDVEELLLHKDPKRGVRGVKLGDEQVVEADKVLIAIGAWTSNLMSSLEDALSIELEMRIEQQVKAAGVCVAHFKLNTKEKELYDRMPIVINGKDGDIQPPPPSGFLKFTNGRTFTNTFRTASNQKISTPPAGLQSNIPQALQHETLDIINRIMPSIQKGGRKMAYWRLCWDAITPTQDQLITRHPDEKLSNLYVAVGGSFHSWKFLPTIGQYITNLLQGKSNGSEKDLHWAWKSAGWDTGGTKGAHEKAIPRRELRDLETPNEASKL